jgi:SAM-dependent methyltransferase
VLGFCPDPERRISLGGVWARSGGKHMTDYVALNAAQVESEVDPFTPTRYEQFAAWFPAQTRQVLDVGCNTGRGGVALKRINPAWQITGLDLLQTRLDRLPESVYGGVICGSATAMPCADKSFDAVVAGEFIEHLPASAAQPFLMEAFRVLRLGGVLAVTTPNPQDWKLRWRKGSVLGGSHVSQHQARVLCLQMKMASFGAVRIRGTGKVSSLLGTRFPLLNVYGSYMAVGYKR